MDSLRTWGPWVAKIANRPQRSSLLRKLNRRHRVCTATSATALSESHDPKNPIMRPCQGKNDRAVKELDKCLPSDSL